MTTAGVRGRRYRSLSFWASGSVTVTTASASRMYSASRVEVGGAATHRASPGDRESRDDLVGVVDPCRDLPAGAASGHGAPGDAHEVDVVRMRPIPVGLVEHGAEGELVAVDVRQVASPAGSDSRAVHGAVV